MITHQPEEITHDRGVSRRRPIEAAKEAVPAIDLADRLCGPGKLRRIGQEWTGRCPLPDHEDRSPSFTVNPEKNLWRCFGCNRGGDVVNLAMLAWGYDQSEAAMAAADLLRVYGHDVPQRPKSWHRKLERQKAARAALEDVKVRSVQRRLMRIYEPYLSRIECDDERREESSRVWHDLGNIARAMVRRSA